MSKRTKTTASAVGDVTLTSSSPEMRAPEPAVASDITPASRTPAVYTQAQREAHHAAICGRISEGMSTRKACEAEGVERATWRKWMDERLVEGAHYVRARLEGADAMAEGIVDIADDRLYDPQERKVMIDARKWVAARLYPRAWGDKLDVTSDGKSIGPIAALPASVLITEGEHEEG